MTPHPNDGPSGLERRPALDGVRGVAILAVMALHTASAYFPGGEVGVDIFFVLSAFLITTLILKEFCQRSGEYSFRNFYIRRGLRLAPALIVWLALVAAPTAILAGQAERVLGSTIASLLYFGNYAAAFELPQLADAYTHIWSLAIEEQFYAVWPVVLVAVLLRRTRRRRLLLWSGLAGAVITFEITSRLIDANYVLPTGHIVPLAAGCLAAYLYIDGAHSRLERVIRHGAVPVVAGIGVVVYTLVAPHETVTGLALLAAAAILHVSWVPRGPAAALLSTPVLLWLGRRSYALYLYHRTLAQTLPLLVPGIPLRIAGPIVLLVSFGLAEASWRLVEKPVQRWGRARFLRAEPSGEARLRTR